VTSSSRREEENGRDRGRESETKRDKEKEKEREKRRPGSVVIPPLGDDVSSTTSPSSPASSSTTSALPSLLPSPSAPLSSSQLRTVARAAETAAISALLKSVSARPLAPPSLPPPPPPNPFVRSGGAPTLSGERREEKLQAWKQKLLEGAREEGVRLKDDKSTHLQSLLRQLHYNRACTTAENCEGREDGRACRWRHAGDGEWFPTLCRYQEKCKHREQGRREGRRDECRFLHPEDFERVLGGD